MVDRVPISGHACIEVQNVLLTGRNISRWLNASCSSRLVTYPGIWVTFRERYVVFFSHASRFRAYARIPKLAKTARFLRRKHRQPGLQYHLVRHPMRRTTEKLRVRRISVRKRGGATGLDCAQAPSCTTAGLMPSLCSWNICFQIQKYRGILTLD